MGTSPTHHYTVVVIQHSSNKNNINHSLNKAVEWRPCSRCNAWDWIRHGQMAAVQGQREQDNACSDDIPPYRNGDTTSQDHPHLEEPHRQVHDMLGWHPEGWRFKLND